MLAPEETRERLFARLNDDAVTHPLPELRLRRPKLFSIPANHQRGFLLPLLLVVHTETR